MINKKKVLILGGEGFIGRNIADYINHYYDCYSLGIKKSEFKKRKDKFIKLNPYKKAIKNNYDVIIHLIDNPVKIKDFSREERRLIKNLNLNKSNHLIIFSSAVVYANPNSEYGKRKLKLEKIYQDYCIKNNITLTILRLFNAYGPYQIPNRQGSLIANILFNYLNNNEIVINDTMVKRDFIYSGDIAKFINYAIKNKSNGIIDLATGRLTKIKELLYIIKNEIIGKDLLINNKKIAETLKCPVGKRFFSREIVTTPLKDGIFKTLDFYKKNNKLINKLNRHV